MISKNLKCLEFFRIEDLAFRLGQNGSFDNLQNFLSTVPILEKSKDFPTGRE